MEELRRWHAGETCDVGRFVNKLRYNPKLKNALLGSMFILPGLSAALQEGDDDLGTSIALGQLAYAPTIADEALATYHGQRIMDKGGLRTSLGQRGKLAGGLLSYIAKPLIAASAGNIVGNVDHYMEPGWA